MWKNKDNYNGLSILPYDGGQYKQAPFESISKEKYEKLIDKLPKKIDLSKIKEKTDNTNRQGEIACAGGKCEI
jgi:ribonucleoside-diphosphate reductase alpha chain